jgi:hypothetical protein
MDPKQKTDEEQKDEEEKEFLPDNDHWREDEEKWLKEQMEKYPRRGGH